MPEISRRLRLLPPLIVLAAAAFLLWGYVTDDTYIHLRYATHLLRLGELSFNPGDPTYGATSPLWILGIVALLKLGVAPLLTVRLLGLGSALLTLAVADRLLSRPVFPAGWRPTLLLLVAADAWFLRWSLSGMETPLAGALLLILLWPAVRAPEESGRTRLWLAWGVAAGMAALTRPEFGLLAVGAAPWLLWQRRRDCGRWLGAAGAMLAGAAVVVLPWLIYCRLAFGRITPETAAAKSYAATFDPAALIDSLIRSAGQLAAVQGLLWAGLAAAALIVFFTRSRGGGSAAALDTAEAPVISPFPVALIGIPLCWLALLAGGYAVKRVWVISRYLSPLLPSLLLAGAVVAARLRDRPAASGTIARAGIRIVLIAACAATVGLNLWWTAGPVRVHARDFSSGVRECFYGMGQWLAENTPPDAVIAAHDIGALGYASERRILDLAGLVSPEILALGREKGFAAMVESGIWLEASRPDYVYDRNPGPPRWDGRRWHGVRFELVDSCVVNGIGLREKQQWTYSLYAVIPTDSEPAAAD